jgi:hypothetical protein
MSRFCNKCNSPVGEKDIVCLSCGSLLDDYRQVLATADKVDTKKNTDSISEFLEHYSKKPSSDAVSEVEAGVAETSVETDGIEKKETPPDFVRKSSSVPRQRGAVENSIRRGQKRYVRKKGYAWATAVAVLLTVLLFSAIVFFVISPRIKHSRKLEEMNGFLAGSWISDEFAFYDSTSLNFVEVLTVNEDGSFKMLYTVPDKAYPTGWKDGKWKIDSEIEGNIEIDTEDSNRLLLLFEKDGENFFFDRHFILKEEDKISLREYYTDEKDSYYDVTLYRINIPKD